jgi:hypothetical protein
LEEWELANLLASYNGEDGLIQLDGSDNSWRLELRVNAQKGGQGMFHLISSRLTVVFVENACCRRTGRFVGLIVLYCVIGARIISSTQAGS